jgi:imidazoleglycerol-phosphate dehydratase/histidinol-phosphatase
MNSDNQKIIFLDRDGTIIFEPEDFQVDSIAKVQLVPEVISSLSRLIDHGYVLVMVTNQDGLGSNSFPETQFTEAHEYVLELFKSQGIEFKDIFICPHFETDNCDCRKPATGLITEFLVQNNIDPQRSYVIGDRDTDMEFSKRLKLQGIKIDPYAKQPWSSIVDEILSVDRKAKVVRQTNETEISVVVNLAVSAPVSISTGIGFFDHMLEQLAKHSNTSIIIECNGDLGVDEHHTVEDVALSLGQAFSVALSNKFGINRYAFTLPMDESLAKMALDLSGRPFCSFEGKFDRDQVGDFPVELVSHFFQSFSQSLNATLHVSVSGENNHHMIEACFKTMGRVLKEAIKISDNTVPSTKGVL